ncbi:hypothetical protein J1N35_023174 [Gossypium stocksii]|uniref:Uncharacterized protein n=1 Tax=Gossypium stocksii TaxID=47602 RepID=A0A9D3VHX1_9ROSI|nr:hypothetical protein J1N35_023174 [Gossypium stocksii]
MNSMAKLIGEHVETFIDKVAANEGGVKDCYSLIVEGKLIRLSQNFVFIIPIVWSTNCSKMRHLWENLHSTIPADGSLGTTIGDFNAILSSKEKRGGQTLGKRCLLFGEFMESAQLQDLGFRGLQFSWQRGDQEVFGQSYLKQCLCSIF